MEIMKAREAAAAGLPRYYTGKPCRAGHVAERHTNGGHCVICDRERERKRGSGGDPKTIAAKRRALYAEAAAERQRQYGPPLRRVLIGLAAHMEGSEARERSAYLNRRLREGTGC